MGLPSFRNARLSINGMRQKMDNSRKLSSVCEKREKPDKCLILPIAKQPNSLYNTKELIRKGMDAAR